MPSLTDSARISRIVIQWSIVGVVALMVGRLVIGGLINWYKQTHPVIPAPTIGFGPLPSIEFPKSERPANITFALETVTGRLPVMPTQADVLLMASTRPNLLAMEQSVHEAANLGFTAQPEKVSDLIYRWRMTNQIPSTLTMDIYSGQLLWEIAWSTNPNFLAEKSLPSQTEAVKEALNITSKLTSETEDLTENSAVVSYLKGIGGAYQSADSLSDADFIQVDLFRKKYKDTYDFVTPQAGHGIVQAVLSGNPKVGRVARMEYNYFPIDYTAVETYPLRTIQQAWEELQTGKGYIAQLDAGTSTVIVREVMLAYFDSFDTQKYMQPVYVFSGDNHFVAYIQAVKDAKTTQ